MNKIGIILILLFLAHTMTACSGSAQSTKAEPDTADTLESPVSTDTVPNLQRTNKLAPGTANIQVRIQSIFAKDESSLQLKLKILNVYGYGSATPPLSAGSELTAHYNLSTKEDATYKTIDRSVGDTLSVSVSYQQTLGANNHRWFIRHITLDSTNQ